MSGYKLFVEKILDLADFLMSVESTSGNVISLKPVKERG